MGYNKFIKKDGKVLLDLTSDTVASDKLMSGVTAHNRSGEAINGTFTIDNELATQDNLIAQIQTALQGKAAGGSTEDLDSVISELETKAATLNTTLANKAAGGGFEISTVTMNIPVVCKYLGTDFQPKEETTSTFETIKNSIAYIDGIHMGGSGHAVVLTTGAFTSTGIAVQLNATIVNISISAGGGSGGSD